MDSQSRIPVEIGKLSANLKWIERTLLLLVEINDLLVIKNICLWSNI